MLVLGRVTFSIKVAGSYFYTWVERSTVRVKFLPMIATQFPQAGLEPGPLDLETSALTMMSPRLLM